MPTSIYTSKTPYQIGQSQLTEAEKVIKKPLVCFNLRGINTAIWNDCFQNKSKFITEDHFAKHMNITIC